MNSLPGREGLPDITLDAASFAALAPPLERVYITENETNFLAFPQVPKAIVVFGAGYGWAALAQATGHRGLLADSAPTSPAAGTPGRLTTLTQSTAPFGRTGAGRQEPGG